MKLKSVMVLLVGSVLVSGVAYAGADDMKWIAQCMQDNANAKVAPETVSIYCTCMNEKMDENETKSITQWEKSHPKEQAECDRKAGWK
ncbi:MAG: hypothetical protein HQL80_10625 [Magnetococcales bacterium]|nr:hypothetical protein [Magnetococcales bacterium]MBF0584668.1 hypothetical protein [Magnetococcales bacterium]